MTLRPRTILGFALAPLGPAAVGVFWFVAELSHDPSAMLSHEFIVVAEVALAFGCAGAFFLGLPIYLLLRYFRRLSLGFFLVGGFFGGVLVSEVFVTGIVSLILRAYADPRISVSGHLGVLRFEGYAAAAGALSAAIFWFVARPDRAARQITS